MGQLVMQDPAGRQHCESSGGALRRHGLTRRWRERSWTWKVVRPSYSTVLDKKVGEQPVHELRNRAGAGAFAQDQYDGLALRFLLHLAIDHPMDVTQHPKQLDSLNRVAYSLLALRPQNGKGRVSAYILARLDVVLLDSCDEFRFLLGRYKSQPIPNVINEYRYGRIHDYPLNRGRPYSGNEEEQSDRLYIPLYSTDSRLCRLRSKSRNPLGLRDLSNSRGGTRTRDPGIMSAV